MGTKAWVLAGLAAVLLAAGPGASPAAGQIWSAPMDLGEGDAVSAGDVGVEADGTAVVAWTTGGGVVRAALRGASGAFGPAATLAPDGGRQAPSVAVDGGGGALAAWSRNGSLGLAERTSGSPALTDVATGIAGILSGPDVAFTGPGQAIVVWVGTDGAVHALSRSLGGSTAALPDLAPGPGNLSAQIGAAGGHAVAAWTHEATVGPETTSRVRSSVMAPGGSFGPAEDVATATFDAMANGGRRLIGARPVVSPAGAADVLLTEHYYMGVPGELGVASSVSTRTMGGWAPPQSLGAVDLAVFAGRLGFDLAPGPAGDALYAEGKKRGGGQNPEMTFSARLRAAGASTYGEASALHAGEPGGVRAAPLTAGRFLVLMQSGSGLRSRDGSPATGFADPLVFSGTDATQLLGLAGAPSGLAAAAWVTTGDRVHAAIYDANADVTAPRLTRLSVSPRRFAVRRRSRAARISWRLSERARVTLRVHRVRPGFRRAGRCVSRRPQAGPARRCLRHSSVGSFVRTRQAGRATLRFNGYVGRRALRPGRYRLTAIPRDAAGNRGTAKRDAFRVKRRG